MGSGGGGSLHNATKPGKGHFLPAPTPACTHTHTQHTHMHTAHTHTHQTPKYKSSTSVVKPYSSKFAYVLLVLQGA